jgi:hypothetical protein
MLVLLPALVAAAPPPAAPPSDAPSATLITKPSAPPTDAPSATLITAPSAPPSAPPSATLITTPSAPPSAPPSAAPSAAPSAPPARQWDSFKILSERNIFLRNRSRPYIIRPAPEAADPVISSDDERVVLTGLVQQGKDYIAFFEDTQTAKTTTVQVGALLGKGRVTAITLDTVEYMRDENTTKIEIGSNLAGVVASLPKPATAASAAAPSAATSTAPAPATATSATGASPAGAPPAPAPVTASTPQPLNAPLPQPLNAPLPQPLNAPLPQPLNAPLPAGAGTSGEVKDRGAASILERMRQRREQELNK